MSAAVGLILDGLLKVGEFTCQTSYNPDMYGLVRLKQVRILESYYDLSRRLTRKPLKLMLVDAEQNPLKLIKDLGTGDLCNGASFVGDSSVIISNCEFLKQSNQNN